MKVALITGTSYGLGHEIAKQLLETGFKVYGISRTESTFNNPQFVWIKADLTSSSEIAAISSKIAEDKIDLLINNAGTAFFQKTLDYTDDDFEKMFNLNFKSPIKLTAALFPKLKTGLILNISSISDRYPDPNYGLYGSSKAALNLFFETMAVENPDTKIINILPSYIDTPMQHALMDGNESFDWGVCMSVDEAAKSVASIISHRDEIDSGSRVLVVKNASESGPYPEKLWLYATSDEKLSKVSSS